MAVAALQDLRDFYNYLTLHIVPGPRSLSYFLPFILPIFALLTPASQLPRKLIQYGLLPLIYAIQLHVWIKHESFDVISMNMALTSFMLLGWYDIRSDFRYVRRANPNSRTASRTKRDIRDREADTNKISLRPLEESFDLEAYPESLVSRTLWVLMLLSSMRLTDWCIGMESHDARQPMRMKSFPTFVRETLTQILFAVVLVDFTSPYMQGLACNYHVFDTVNSSIFSRALESLVLLAHFYAVLSLGLALLPYLVSIVALFLVPAMRSNSMTSPLTWPSLFGPLSSIFSYSSDSRSRNLGLRAFWGIFWHQNMRYITSTPGVALASFFGLKSGSKSRYMVVVASGFFWSGIVHMGVVPPEPVGTNLNSWQMRLRLASFFWLQILGIFVEECVQSLFDLTWSSSKSRQRLNVVRDVLKESERESRSFRVQIGAFLVKCSILIWTIGFLGFSVLWTVLPVGCELGWFDVRLAPGVYRNYWAS